MRVTRPQRWRSCVSSSRQTQTVQSTKEQEPFSWLHRRRRQPYTVDTISQLFCCRWNAKNETHNAAMRILAIVLKKSQTFSQDRTTQKVRFLSCPRYVAHTGVGRVCQKRPRTEFDLGETSAQQRIPALAKRKDNKD